MNWVVDLDRLLNINVTRKLHNSIYSDSIFIYQYHCSIFNSDTDAVVFSTLKLLHNVEQHVDFYF